MTAAAPAVRITGQAVDVRVLHAFPERSAVALCGARKARTAQPQSGVRCAVCEQEAGRQNWVSR